MVIEITGVRPGKPGAGRARRLILERQARENAEALKFRKVNLEKAEEARRAEEARIKAEEALPQWKAEAIRGSYSFSGDLYGFKPMKGGNLTWAEAQAECERLALENAKKIKFDRGFFQECLNF